MPSAEVLRPGRADEAHDVIVFGAGPAGCATAIALCQAGVARVLVIEPGRKGPRVGESIPPATRMQIEALGCWDAFVAQRHDPCLGSCSSWGDDRLGYNDFLLDPLGHGWHLDRGRFDALLDQRAGEVGATIRRGSRFAAVERDTHGFRVRLVEARGSVEVRARVLVDATGHRARIARALGASRWTHDRLGCVLGVFEPGEPPSEPDCRSSLTMLEAVEQGWWYAARLPGGRAVVGHASDPDHIRAAGLHRREGWMAALRSTRHVGPRFVGSPAPELWTCSAPSSRLDHAAGPNWIAVGDAAAATDPIASIGIHQALDDGLRAGERIVARLAGRADAFERYADSVASRFAEYLDQRNYFYGLERRFASSPFWRRRWHHSGLATGSA